MTKLEELKAVFDAAELNSFALDKEESAARNSTDEADYEAWIVSYKIDAVAWEKAYDDYHDELKKQQEKTND